MKIYGLSIKDFVVITLREIRYALDDHKLKESCKNGRCPSCCTTPCTYNSPSCNERTLRYTKESLEKQKYELRGRSCQKL